MDCGGTCPACATCTPTIWEAETAFHSTGYSVTGGWALGNNGYIETVASVTMPPTPSSLVVTARGTVLQGVWAHMIVSIGTTTLGSVFVNTTAFAPYRFNVPANLSGKIRVTYDNDAKKGGEDRNLFVDKLALECGSPAICVGAATYEAETMFHSTGSAVTDGWRLASNGYVLTTHTFAGGLTRITVAARGTVAGGVWPRMVVSVGGTVIGTVFVNTTGFSPWVFDFTQPAGSAEIRVEFTNDGIVGQKDRDLFVDKVSVGCP